MIEQNLNKLILTFPSTDSATTFAVFLRSLLQTSQPALGTSSLSFDPSPESAQVPATGLTPDFLEPRRSRHAVLTEERQDQLFNQRVQGQSAHQRLLRAQTILRDGMLPFSRPGSIPAPSGQPSPRQRAQQEGGFADGAAQIEHQQRPGVEPGPKRNWPAPGVESAAPRKTKLQRSPKPLQS